MRVLILQNYTKYITNKERVSWPISARYFFLKLFLIILCSITSSIVLNWENQAVSVLCVRGLTMVSGKGYKGGRSRGISTKTSDPPPPPLPTPNNMPLKTNPLWVQHCRARRGGWKDEPNLSRTTNCH